MSHDEVIPTEGRASARLAALESELQTLREEHLRVSEERDRAISARDAYGDLLGRLRLRLAEAKSELESAKLLADKSRADAANLRAELAEERRFTGRLFDALRGGK